MKLFKSIAVSGLAVAALVQSTSAAGATDHVYLTGSSAFRTAAIAAINSTVGLAGPTGSDASISGIGNTSFIWQGGTDPVTGTPVTVVATFTGSASGVGITANSIAIPFLPDGATGTSNPPAYDDAQGTTPHAGYTKFVPDFTFSDVYQAATPFTTTAGYTDLSSNDSIVAIATFKWMGSKNFPRGTGVATATTLPSSYSVTPNFIQQMMSTGLAPMSFLSGVAADEHKEVFATGRNPDSGTRITALADSKYGANNAVKQWSPTISGGVVTSHKLYPIETIFGLLSTGSLGNSGEASGANVVTALQATLPNTGLWTSEKSDGTVNTTQPTPGTTGAFYMAYLGLKDANSVEGNTANLTGAVELTYNGYLYSNTNIQEGNYTMWSYEHVMDRGDLSPTGGVAGTAAATDVETTMIGFITTPGNTNIPVVGLQNDASMHVKRAGDGKLVQPKFTF